MSQNLYRQVQRQDWITRVVLEHGSVTIDDLVAHFKVSRMTVHRDLDDLERQGVLRKVRNGATAQPSSLFESDVRYRLPRELPEKEAICEAALAFIEPGQSVLLDEATTLLPLARRLADLGQVTVITNFLLILNELSRQPSVHLVGLGGDYLPRFETFTGLVCERAVAELHVDVFFTSTTAVHNGCAFHPEPQIVSVKRAMMAHSTRRYLLADHGKFGKTALLQVASLTDFDAVIVDDGISPAHLAAMRDAGVRVEVAPRVAVHKGSENGLP